MDKEISIILCTYNEVNIIEKTIKNILEHNPKSEIIIVDDNSNDGTVEVIKNLNLQEVKLINRKSRGLASACLTGLLYSNCETICWIDSNLPDLAEKIPKMCETLNEKNIVIMSRYVKGGSDLRSPQRILTSKLINFLCRLILNGKIKDYTSGIFAIKKSFLIDVAPICYGHGEYFIEFVYKASKLGYEIIEIPYIQPPDSEGISKTAGGLLRFLKLGFQYLIRIVVTRIRPN